MTIEITDTLKAQITLSAITAAGVGATDDAVTSQIARIIEMLQDGSPQQRAFEAAAKRAENFVKADGFKGTVVYVDLEGKGVDGKQPTNRPIVFLKTQPSKYYEDGIEHIRLQRTDDRQFGERAKQLAKQAQSLLGHVVSVSKIIETGGGNNQRVLSGLQDLGPDPEFSNGITLEQGAAMIDWTRSSNPRRSELVPRLVRLAQLQPAG